VAALEAWKAERVASPAHRGFRGIDSRSLEA
jgi:hypothetical protein